MLKLYIHCHALTQSSLPAVNALALIFIFLFVPSCSSLVFFLFCCFFFIQLEQLNFSKGPQTRNNWDLWDPFSVFLLWPRPDVYSIQRIYFCHDLYHFIMAADQHPSIKFAQKRTAASLVRGNRIMLHDGQTDS